MSLKKYDSLKKVRRVSPKKRLQVLVRDNFTCCFCGAGKEKVLEVDHIIPFAKGGDCHIENLQTLCFECNRGKKDNIIYKKKNRSAKNNIFSKYERKKESFKIIDVLFSFFKEETRKRILLEEISKSKSIEEKEIILNLVYPGIFEGKGFEFKGFEGKGFETSV